MTILRPMLAFLLTLWCAGAGAATAVSVVDIPTRGVAVRILYLRPDNPVANIVVWPGGDGGLGIQDDGTMITQLAACNPAVRNRQAFAELGYAIAVVDAASDGVVWAYADAIEVIRYMQAHDLVPTWVMGGSTATRAAVNLAGRAPLGKGLGVVFYSPESFGGAQPSLITAPAVIVYHQADARQRATSLINGLTSAAARLGVTLSGGTNVGCAGFHTLNGLDGPFVSAVADFIGAYNPTLVATPLGETATAVEFYNASLDHYFVTHRVDEIAVLDAGTTIRGWVRTRQAFNVYVAASSDTSPVCRFYIPPEKGDSHFYGRGTAECIATGAANPSFVNEDAQFFHVALPDAGVCPAGTRNVYRVFSNRADANHRYTVDPATRDEMVSKGWLAEGDGPDRVVMCSP